MGSQNAQKSAGDRLQDQTERTRFINTADAGTFYMAYTDKDVIVTITAAVEVVLMLPPVGECQGEFFSVEVPDAGSGCLVVAYGDASSLDDAIDWTDIDLNADNDNCLLYSNGRKWIVLAQDEN